MTRTPLLATSASVLLALGTSGSTAGHRSLLQEDPGARCELSGSDLGWIRDALAAWRHASGAILGLEDPPEPLALFFDSRCVVSTERLRLDGREQEWRASPHEGEVVLPDGNTMPPVVTSFAAPLEGSGGCFFVMSTPSLWRAGGVTSEMPLESLMTAVLLHEISHASQVGTYMRRVSELEAAGRFGDDLTDDVLQDTFAGEDELAAAVRDEIDLLFRAAGADRDAEALRLAREARDSIAGRRAGYRDRAQLHELEDVFLTLEGAAQWTAYTWLTAAEGGNLEPELVLRDFGRRTDRWSQVEGLALFLVIDRFVPGWTREVFGDGSSTALRLLDRALE